MMGICFDCLAEFDRELVARPFLDALFGPRQQVFAPADETVVCRCEEITAGEITALAPSGSRDRTRSRPPPAPAWAPCQGRQCGYTVTRILAAVQSRPPSEVGFSHIRPPLKPVPLGEVASLDLQATPSEDADNLEEETE